MRIYDISQEVFSCVVYPEDDAPKLYDVRRMKRGDAYNLTNFSMCAHNGTHIDAPFHFLGDGKTVDEVSLEKTVGKCYVAEEYGVLNAESVHDILRRAKEVSDEASKRILIKGDAIVTADVARVFVNFGISLIGVEGQSVGDSASPADVHRILLKSEIVLLEGIRLSQVSEGEYFLCAAPICLGGADGAPCRAILIETAEL